MDKTTFLYEIAREFGIEVRYEPLHQTHHPKVDGYAWPSKGLIVLDQSIVGTRQETCVLAEELGHCLFPPVVDQLMYHSKAFRTLGSWQQSNHRCLVVKDERAAVRWATDFVISDAHFWAYFDCGPRQLWEWCDHFQVESWFAALKIGYMLDRGRHPGGRPFRRRDAVKPGVRPSL